jgi:DeoD family purine-nucleoside phosphorylase
LSARVSSETLHLRPHAPIAERVLLPGDPGRAMRLAQLLLEAPKMLNHHRGLWGYTGLAADGEPLTVQSTGMGGPSTAIVCEELVMLGARRFIRVGTCGALAGSLALGDLVVAEAALAEDGASRALGGNGSATPDARLHAALSAAAPGAHAGTIVSADLFYDPDPARADRWTRAGALAVEMEAATLFRIAERHGLAAACVCVVSDLVSTRERIDPDALEAAEGEMGRVAAAALAVGS